MAFEYAEKIWDNVFGNQHNLWIVQASFTQRHIARKTASGLLRLMTALERYPQRALLESTQDTPAALVEAATYAGSPLLRYPIPTWHTASTPPWPATLAADTFLVVDDLTPSVWLAFNTWRGQRAALVIFEVDDGMWIPPGVGQWVLNVSETVSMQRYHPPALESSLLV